MEETIICPNCQHENSNTSTKCENCGHVFSTKKIDDAKNDLSDNWLDSLRKTGELREIEPTGEEEATSFFDSKDDVGGIPDWLKRIQDVNDLESTYKSSPETLKDLKESQVFDKSSHFDQEEKNETNYEWLQDFRNYSEVEEKSNDSGELKSTESTDEEVLEEEPLLSIDEIKKNWQNEFPTLSKNLDEEEIEPADDLPAWLNADLDLEKPESDLISSNEEASPSEDFQKNPDHEFPEWLKRNGEPAADSLADSLESETSVPNWLHTINASQEKSLRDEQFETSDQDSDEDEFVDSDLLFNKLEINVDTQDEESSEMDQITSEAESIEQESSSSAFIFEKNDLPAEKPFLFDDKEAQLYQEPSPFNEDYPYAEDKEFEEIDPITTQNGDVDSVPFSFEGIPDWLEKVRLDELDTDIDKFSPEYEEDQTRPQPKIEKTQANDISKANLPEWLKAIRPIEVVTPDVSDVRTSKRVEKAGPLAGLKGVLSTEDISNLYTSSSLSAINIDVTEKQRLQAKLLEEIVSPLDLQTTTAIKKSTERNLQTVVIPLLFLLLMVFSLFINTKIFNFPLQIPAETVRFHNILTGYLNQNQTSENILLISEVDTSAFPEMSLITKSVVENLYSNNHRISSVSTNPNGIIVSNTILQNRALSVPTYNFSENFINFGYLPANHLGIQSFLTNPRGTIQVGNEGAEIWTSSFLTDVNSINDFDLFILLTDNSEKARQWIEQIEMFAPDVGFLVVATTQSTPLLQPYVESNQIDGMIGGIIEGLAFERLTDIESEDLSRFSFFLQIAVLIIIILLISGSLITIFANMKNLIQEKKKQ